MRHLLGRRRDRSGYRPALTDAGLATMQKIQGLKLVTLQGTKVTAQGVAELRQALPECKVEWDGK